MATQTSPSVTPLAGRLALAAKALVQGQVLAYPTEAVWGLGCLPQNRHAVARILALKKRSADKGLILVSGDIRHFQPLLNGLDAPQLHALLATWPGPYTWLVPHQQKVPSIITGSHDYVAIRVSAHPVIRALTAAVGGPIVSTSANPQGLAPARTSWRARAYFGREVAYAPGHIGASAKPTEIRNALTGHVIRSA